MNEHETRRLENFARQQGCRWVHITLTDTHALPYTNKPDSHVHCAYKDTVLNNLRRDDPERCCLEDGSECPLGYFTINH